MKIAVLGTGNVGSTLGKAWACAGHHVVFGSREPGADKVRLLVADCGALATAASQAEAAQQGDIVLLAAPWSSMQQTIAGLGNLAGKVLIDCINPLNETFSGLTHGHSVSAAELVASWAPGAHVVKAFNTVSARVMANPDFGGYAATLFYCGDDKGAKQKVKELSACLGFDPVDAGPLINARYLEPLAMLYIHLAVREGWGSNTAFKILKRPAT